MILDYIKLGDMVTIDNPNSSSAKWGTVIDMDIIFGTIDVYMADGTVDLVFENEIQAIQFKLNIK